VLIRELQARANVLDGFAKKAATLSPRECVDAMQTLLGEGFLVVEPFAIDAARAPARLVVEREALERFVTVASFVRPALRRLGHARDLSAFAGNPTVPVHVLQHPDGEWAGGTLSKPGTGAEIVCFTAFGKPGEQRATGVLLDNWMDIVPSATEVSGIAISYDQPDAQPPQSMLLVVPPRVHPGAGATPRRWLFEDVVIALDDTLELAKIRAIEPEHLVEEAYGALLPMTVGEILPRAVTSTPTDVVGERVMLDFGAIG
jgi:hypothetical protein